MLVVSSDQRNRSLTWVEYKSQPFSPFMGVYHRLIISPLAWIRKRRVIVLAVLVLAALVVAAVLGIPPAWRLGPTYFEAIGTWVGAVGGIAAILVAGGALYHQRTTDLRAAHARETEIDDERGDELAHAVRFRVLRMSQDDQGVWCVHVEVTVSRDFPYAIRDAVVHGVDSDPSYIGLAPPLISPGGLAKADLRFPGMDEDMVRLNREFIALQFICWGKGWRMRPTGDIEPHRRLDEWTSHWFRM
jgi:hypothetical protein